MKNLTKQNVYFSWSVKELQKESFVPYLKLDTVNKILNLELKRENKHKEMMVFLGGFGGWNNEHINELANNLNFIEIKGVTTNLRITDKQEITKFLLSRKRRYNIKINID